MYDDKGRQAHISPKRGFWKRSSAPASSKVRIPDHRQWGIAGLGEDRPLAVIKTGARKLSASDVAQRRAPAPGCGSPGPRGRAECSVGPGGSAGLETLPSGSKGAWVWKLKHVNAELRVPLGVRGLYTHAAVFTPSGQTCTEARGRASWPEFIFHLSTSISNAPFSPRCPQRLDQHT